MGQSRKETTSWRSSSDCAAPCCEGTPSPPVRCSAKWIPRGTPFYRVLIASPETPSLELVAALQSVVAGMGDNLPAELKSEAEFYLGCAALESGDTLTVLTAFIESEATAPDSPYREIRGVYLRQLTR